MNQIPIHEVLDSLPKTIEQTVKNEGKIVKGINTGISEIKQIEEWTGMKIGNIIFDLDVDNWDQHKSEFDNLIKGFGGYISAKIDKIGNHTNDTKSFLFSLKSNGRLNGMLKFDILNPNYAFFFNNQPHAYLFAIGGGIDILIFKQKHKDNSYCNPLSYDYNEIQSALCGKQYPNPFTPRRITVFQLI